MSATRTRTWNRGLLASSFFIASLLLAASSFAADEPNPAELLSKLHQSNQKEIAAGKEAEKRGTSKEVKSFGKMLVKDHSDADKKVMAFAKKEKLDLGAMTSAPEGSVIAEGPNFDSRFAQEMLDDHKKDVAEVTAARDKTTHAKLKELLSKLLPTLEKHQEMAQKILDDMKK